MTEIPMNMTQTLKWLLIHYNDERERLNMTEINKKSINSLRRRTCAVEYDRNNRSTSIAHVCRCGLFGHAQIFRSHSFGHVDSVKRLLLNEFELNMQVISFTLFCYK